MTRRSDRLVAVLAAAGGVVLTGLLPAQAAVSGYWQSSAEIHAAISHNQVADALRQQPIREIEREGDDKIRIHSRDCAVEVTVTRRDARRPGKQDFDLSVGRGRCR